MSTIPSLSSLNESYRIHASSGQACFFWGGAVGSQKGGHLNLASCVTRARWLSYLNLSRHTILDQKPYSCLISFDAGIRLVHIVLSPKALTHHHREVLNEPGTTSLSFHHFLQPIRSVCKSDVMVLDAEINAYKPQLSPDTALEGSRHLEHNSHATLDSFGQSNKTWARINKHSSVTAWTHTNSGQHEIRL